MDKKVRNRPFGTPLSFSFSLFFMFISQQLSHRGLQIPVVLVQKSDVLCSVIKPHARQCRKLIGILASTTSTPARRGDIGCGRVAISFSAGFPSQVPIHLFLLILSILFNLQERAVEQNLKIF